MTYEELLSLFIRNKTATQGRGFLNEFNLLSQADKKIQIEEWIDIYKPTLDLNVTRKTQELADAQTFKSEADTSWKSLIPTVDVGTKIIPLSGVSSLPSIRSQSSITSLIAGTNIVIDNTDPKNPIINSTGGASGSSAWGDITGTLSAQTDLSSALAEKVATTDVRLTDSRTPLTHTHTKSDVGLGSVDNTADTAKPVSTAQQTALNTKESIANKGVANGYASLDATGKVPASQVPASGGGIALGANNELNLPTAIEPVPSPTAGVSIYAKPLANRMIPTFIGPSALETMVQPFFARNKIGHWNPQGNSTILPAVFGFTAPTAVGTVTARNVATTNFFTRMRRLGYVSAATVGALASWRVAVAQQTIGNGAGLGGFMMIIRFGCSDAATVAGARQFIGMSSNTGAPTNVEPSTLLNCIGVGHGASDTNLKIFYAGSAAQTPINLGVNFPANTLSTDMYELTLFASPSTSTVNYQVTRLNTGHTASGVLSGVVGTAIPAATTLLTPAWAYRTNNATALAVGLDIASCYIETDN